MSLKVTNELGQPKGPKGPKGRRRKWRLVSQVLEDYAAVQGTSVSLNGSFCAQVKARPITV